MDDLRAPFPYFGGKRDAVSVIWRAFGRPKQYIEPFCGSCAVLLAAPSPASLEVINDANGFLANFWRVVKNNPADAARWADYPVSHIDLGARHGWLMNQRGALGAYLQDPNWPGDAKVAGWWLWGQCSWIGSGWCEWDGKIPHAWNAGVGVNAIGKIPHASNAGRGETELLTSAGRTAWHWLHRLAARLERVRMTHGDWSRCLNNHYGGESTAVFLDPPYLFYEKLYGNAEPVATACAEWARRNESLRIGLCGHRGDYDLPGWTVHEWSRGKYTYSGNKTTDREAIWFSPACLPLEPSQGSLW